MTVTVCNSATFDTCPVATIYSWRLALATQWPRHSHPGAGNPSAWPQGAFLLDQGFPPRPPYWVRAFSLQESHDWARANGESVMRLRLCLCEVLTPHFPLTVNKASSLAHATLIQARGIRAASFMTKSSRLCLSATTSKIIEDHQFIAHPLLLLGLITR